MRIGVLRETDPEESRVPLVPESVKKLSELGSVEVLVEAGLGKSIYVSDGEYEAAGAQVTKDTGKILADSDIIIRLGKPTLRALEKLNSGHFHISYLDPFFSKEHLDALKKSGATALSMEMIPRSTLAQKMDALSSQANLAGYVAVIVAAERLNKAFPMMMTPAATISPSRVFVIGAGVAGLQAIATAKRLGARVEAFDTRPVVEEQVQSLGAKFVKIDLGETSQTQDGYAKELTLEQLEKQRELMKKHIQLADVVITTAQVFGRKAPVIVTKDMVEGMRPGSILVDLAVETGGNVEGSQPGEAVDVNGVTILGLRNLPGRVPLHSSQMYSANVTAFLTHFWDKESKTFQLDRDDEILKSAVVVRGGELVNPMLKNHWEKS